MMQKIFSMLVSVFMLGQMLHAQKVEIQGSLKLSEIDTMNNLDGNLVMSQNGTLTIRKYKIGDLAHGGIVFYIDSCFFSTLSMLYL